MPKFLQRNELYKLTQRELPEGVYATTLRPQEFLTTADDDSLAFVLAQGYETLERVYDNYFPTHTDEFIDKWEFAVFGQAMDASSGLAFRRDRLLTKLRARKGIRKVDIAELVYLVIGSDKQIEIIENSAGDGSWILDVSLLDQSTIFSTFSGLTAALSGPDLWEKSAAELGLTEDELAQYKADAYGYKVRIINYEATAAELAEIERLLTKYEPARSWHTIENNATLEVASFEWLLDFSELDQGTYV